MTKKDYELIAYAVKQALTLAYTDGSQHHFDGAKMVAHQIAHCLESENERFNYDKFIKACGIEG